MQDLLYGMALQSANEAANIVADYLGNGSISDFVELMNKKRQETVRSTPFYQYARTV